MTPFPFPTASTRFKMVFALDDGMFECEKNADGPNHALERAHRHIARERLEQGGSLQDLHAQLLTMEVIATGTKPDA